MTKTQRQALKKFRDCLTSVQRCSKVAIQASRDSIEAADFWVETEKIRIKITKRSETDLAETEQVISGTQANET